MPRVKSRKTTVQDRPSARTLLLRRLRKAWRPLALVVGLGVLVIAVPFGLRGAEGLAHWFRDATARLSADAGFRVARIEVNGVTPAGRDAVEQALGVRPGMPILGVSPEAAAARVTALGTVRSAVVERLLPDTLVVTVIERKPLAIWQQPDGTFALIGTTGAVLTDRDAAAARREDPGLKLLVGAGAPDHAQDLLDLLAKFPLVDSRVVAAERIDHLRWNLILRDHTVVELPDAHPERALAVLMQAERKVRLLERPVRKIDLRLADRLVVRPYPKGFISGGDGSAGSQPEHKS